MALSVWFWLVMTAWLLLGAFPYARGADRNWSGMGSALIAWIAVAIVGFQVFGSFVK